MFMLVASHLALVAWLLPTVVLGVRPSQDSLVQVNLEYSSERNLILRTSESSWVQFTNDSHLQNEVDLFFAFDTAVANTARRALVRRWLADVESRSKLRIAHAFFSDGPLAPGSHDFVLQPKKNRLRPGADVVSGWTKRWLFDIKWAVERIEFSSIIRADDDGFQCGAALENLLGHLSLRDPLMVFSSESVPKHTTTRSSSLSKGLLYQWPWEERRLPDFEENWMLLSKPMARSIVDMLAGRQPGADQILPEYLQELRDSHLWPPKGTLVADVGRFDNDTSYEACTDPLTDDCAQGFNVWDSSFHGVCATYEACTQACRKDGLLWLHHVELESG